MIMGSSYISNIIEKIEKFTKKPDKYLSVQDEQAEEIKLLTRELYNLSKKKENRQKKNLDTLEELIIEGLDDEQIWQQVELQNNSICNSLVSDVAHLLAKKDKLVFPLKEKVKKKEKDKKNQRQKNNDIAKRENGVFQQEEEEEEEEDDEDEENIETRVRNKKMPVKSSVVDDKFFKLHEMEKFLEKMEKGEGGGDDDEEIDYFEDDSSGLNDDPEEKFHYNDFFDQPDDEQQFSGKRKNSNLDEDGKIKKKVKFSIDEEDSEEEEIEGDDGDDNYDEEENIDFDELLEEDENENEDDDENADEDDSKNDEDEGKSQKETNKQPSTFEARQERLKSRISALEEEALKEKPWQLKGEVTATNRPQNSLLQEYVEFDIATRPAPVLTEKSTLKLEDVIIQRIKDKAWDDVVRKIKPVEGDMEYKKKLVLDQEKSKLSLAQIYEKEYLSQLESKNEDLTDKPEIEPPEHQEIRNMMNKLFFKLDALSNFHFTPKQITPEIKIISNVPAISMEEVAPIATSDATLLAPEEVKKKPKGDLIGKSERTTTDKKRERRQKKIKQKLKYQDMEAKAKLKAEKEGAKAAQDKKISQKLLQKITKSSNITQLEESEGGKYVKSSNAFFSKLQDETSSKIKKKGLDMKKSKPGKNLKNTKKPRAR